MINKKAWIFFLLLIAVSGSASGCSGKAETTDTSVLPTIEVKYVETYHSEDLPEETTLICYDGTRIDFTSQAQTICQAFHPAFDSDRKITTESSYYNVAYSDNSSVTISADGLYYFTSEYDSIADYLQLNPGDMNTEDLFPTDREFDGFSRSTALEQLTLLGNAIGIEIPELYTAYAMDTASMEAARQRFVDGGDTEAAGETIPAGEYYYFYFTPQYDGHTLLNNDDLMLGGRSTFTAVVKKGQILSFAVSTQYQYQPDQSATILPVSEAEKVFNQKYQEILSDQTILVNSVELAYFQEKINESIEKIRLKPVYAFTLIDYPGNPSRKVLIDAQTGKEILEQL